MHYRQLGRTGLNVSVISYGASPLGNAFRTIDEGEGIRTVRTALDLGINFIDTSPHYGETRSETVLGRALQGVPRESYILATKVGQYGEGKFNFSAEHVTQGFDESCRRLGTERVDVLHIHDIEFADLNQIVNESLPALVKLKEAGRVGHIGITGLSLKIFPAVLDRTAPGVVEAVLSFCRYCLNDTALDPLIPYFERKGVGVINASATGMGLLTDRGGPAWHPASPEIKEGCRRAVEQAKAIGIDITKLAIQFAVHDPRIATTLVGTANPENIRKNVEYAGAPIDFEAMARVLEFLKPIKNHNFTRGRPENRDPLYP
ncbi:aldo/keto reductase [Oleiharenicola lentus]|uniref:aldo/keto reductase n=1 Tax=Oleiharenicola lentus TaxID=2508720 RepID=UPI003F663693